MGAILTRGKKDFVPSSADIASFSSNQILVFLETVQKSDRPLTAERARLMGRTYNLLASKNAELKSAYYEITMRAADETSYAGIAELLGRVGRMKFVRPLFRSLNKADRELAVKTFERNREFYHPICRSLVEKDLGLV